MVILLGVLFAAAGQTLVQRLMPLPLRESQTAAMGLIYAALYVMYGVTLAFSLFLVAQAFATAQRTTENEAGDVEALYRLAEQFPEPKRHEIQELARSYARVVVEEEWPMLGQGRTSRASPQAEALADELTESVEDFEPGTSSEQALYTQGLTVARDLEKERDARLHESRQGIPPLLWIVLVTGGVITIAFTFFFGMETPWLHRLSVAGLTVVIVLVLYTIYRLDYPFSGAVQVGPDAFELVLQEIEDDSER